LQRKNKPKNGKPLNVKKRKRRREKNGARRGGSGQKKPRFFVKIASHGWEGRSEGEACFSQKSRKSYKIAISQKAGSQRAAFRNMIIK